VQFQIFFLVVVFGLFHGLIFLPVILSFIGPNAYPAHVSNHEVPSNAVAVAQPVYKSNSENDLKLSDVEKV
jgi:hypothetical protein